jgi:hypothetical protein
VQPSWGSWRAVRARAPGAVAQMVKRGSAESVSASMPEPTRVRLRRLQARRTRALVL